MRSKVQTNDYKVNVLVESENSTNRNHYHLNKDVEILNVLSDNEIMEAWKKRDKSDELRLAKDWIKKQEGYAISSCKDKVLKIDYDSIVQYKELKN